MLQHVMFPLALLLLLLLGCNGACNQQHRSLPRPLMHAFSWVEAIQHNEQQGAQMMHAMPHTQHALKSSNAAVVTQATADPPGPGASCATLHNKRQCTDIKDCLWCQNKDSPWPGSDGVCVEPDQAKYLPDATYTCTPKPTALPEQAAAVQLPGDAQSCGTVRDKKKCSTQKGCIWCQNKHSPWPGSDGVCVDPDQAKYLPPSAYKCDRKPTAVVHIENTSPTAGKPKPDPSKSCSVLHDKDTCATRKNCIWCKNKFSPWSGSDGVCIEPEHAYELPKWTYKCGHQQNVAIVAA